jgi:HK97 family phage portal protein
VFPNAWIPRDLRITNEQAISVSVVYACIRAIAEAMASSPWQVFKVEGRKRELAPDDSLVYLLSQRPNPEITAIAFREALLYSALSEGNGYAEIQRDGSDRPLHLWPLDATRMTVKRFEDRLVYEYADEDGAREELDPRNVFHLRGPVCASALLGDSVVGRASRSAALMTAAQRFGLSYLANGAQPTGVLTYPGKLDPKSMERIRDQVAEKQGGTKNAGKPLLLEGGMKFEPVQSDPAKAMMLDSMVWSVEDIGRYFGVPQTLLNVSASAQGYGSNQAAIFLAWTKMGLTPWKLRLEQEANEKLFPTRQRGAWRETCIDTEWLTRGDAKAQAEADEIRVRSGIETVNEVLERSGKNTVGPEGDIRLITSDLQPLTPTLLEIQEASAKPPPPPSPAVPAPSEEDQDETGDEAGEQTLNEAGEWAQTIIAACLDRYGARMRARKRNLETERVADAEAKLGEERAKLLDRVIAEVEAASKLSGKDVRPQALGAACASVESGATAEQAAAHYWSTT